MNILYYGSSNTKTFSSIIGLNIIEVYSSISRYYSNYTDNYNGSPYAIVEL